MTEADPLAAFRDHPVTTTVCVPPSALIDRHAAPTYEAFIAVCFLIMAVAGIVVAMHHIGGCLVPKGDRTG